MIICVKCNIDKATNKVNISGGSSSVQNFDLNKSSIHTSALTSPSANSVHNDHNNDSAKCDPPSCMIVSTAAIKYKCDSCSIRYHTQCASKLLCNITTSGNSIRSLTCELCTNKSSSSDCDNNKLKSIDNSIDGNAQPSSTYMLNTSTQEFSTFCTQLFTAIEPHMHSLIVDVFNKEVHRQFNKIDN